MQRASMRAHWTHTRTLVNKVECDMKRLPNLAETVPLLFHYYSLLQQEIQLADLSESIHIFVMLFFAYVYRSLESVNHAKMMMMMMMMMMQTLLVIRRRLLHVINVLRQACPYDRSS